MRENGYGFETWKLQVIVRGIMHNVQLSQSVSSFVWLSGFTQQLGWSPKTKTISKSKQQKFLQLTDIFEPNWMLDRCNSLCHHNSIANEPTNCTKQIQYAGLFSAALHCKGNKFIHNSIWIQLILFTMLLLAHYNEDDGPLCWVKNNHTNVLSSH